MLWFNGLWMVACALWRSKALRVVPWLHPCTRLWLMQDLGSRHNPACLWYPQCTGNHFLFPLSDNGLSPDQRKVIIWTNTHTISIRHQRTYFNENLVESEKFSFKKMHLKMPSAKRRPFCLSLNVLTHCGQVIPWHIWHQTSGHHWFRQRPVTNAMVPSHYLNQCWLMQGCIPVGTNENWTEHKHKYNNFYYRKCIWKNFVSLCFAQMRSWIFSHVFFFVFFFTKSPKHQSYIFTGDLGQLALTDIAEG